MISAICDDRSVLAHAGVVPLLRIARDAGLAELAEEKITVAGSADANAAAKLVSIVAGMATSADSIDDLDVLRHGAMHRLFKDMRASSRLGTFLRGFDIGHATASEAISAWALIELAQRVPRLLA